MNYKTVEIMHISIIVNIMIIAELVLLAGEGPVQWVVLSYLLVYYDMSSRSQVVLSNLVII